jgi:hypothetical protein
MLRILGSPKTLCTGLTRRDLLHVGGLGLLGLTLPDFLRAQTAPARPPRRFGQAKACILLYLYGSPSQLELADMKPDAPLQIRGELRPIRSAVPGLDVCELLPRIAQVTDRLTVVRSMSHPYPIHGVAYATTGTPTIDIPMELAPRDARHWPFLGSVVDYLERQRGGPRRDIPNNVALPWMFSSRRNGEVPRAGPYAGFLGNAYDPVWTTFTGRATRRTVKTLNNERLECDEPYMGIARDSRFTLGGDMGPELTLDRLDTRRSLLEQLDAARGAVEPRDLDRYRAMAYDLISSPRVRQALDIGRESGPVRDAYGMTVFGQAALAARRLVEAGCRFVTVFWDEFGLAGSGWDTHWDHYPRMRDELCPGFDWGLSGLLHDLDARGILDETLVLVLSEHGRTPRINNAPGGGRDHWSEAYTVLLAGGGVPRGHVIGRTDRHAATVTERPISPKDLLATTYHLLGIDPETTLTDRLGRPVPLVAGNVVPELLA